MWANFSKNDVEVETAKKTQVEKVVATNICAVKIETLYKFEDNAAKIGANYQPIKG